MMAANEKVFDSEIRVHDWFSFPLGCLVVCSDAERHRAAGGLYSRFYLSFPGSGLWTGAHYSFTKEKIPERFRKMKATSFRSAWFRNTGRTARRLINLPAVQLPGGLGGGD